jgi:hypothetical protein
VVVVVVVVVMMMMMMMMICSVITYTHRYPHSLRTYSQLTGGRQTNSWVIQCLTHTNVTVTCSGSSVTLVSSGLRGQSICLCSPYTFYQTGILLCNNLKLFEDEAEQTI